MAVPVATVSRSTQTEPLENGIFFAAEDFDTGKRIYAQVTGLESAGKTASFAIRSVIPSVYIQNYFSERFGMEQKKVGDVIGAFNISDLDGSIFQKTYYAERVLVNVFVPLASPSVLSERSGILWLSLIANI